MQATGILSFNVFVTFDDVIELYDFDRHLRILVMYAIERIDVAIRTLICTEIEEENSPLNYKISLIYLGILDKYAEAVGLEFLACERTVTPETYFELMSWVDYYLSVLTQEHLI